MVFPVNACVSGVLHYANNFMRSIPAGLAGPGKTKAMADRVAISEELLDEFLVHDRDGRRIQRVLRLKTAPHHDPGTDRIKVFRRALYPRCAFVQIRLSLDLYAGSPIVLFHWRVGGEADF